MKNLKISKANKKDIKKISKIYQESFSEYPYEELWTRKKAIAKIKRFYKYCDVWNLMYKKNIIGFIVVNSNLWFPGEACFGEELAIKKEFRNKGFGTFFLKEIWRMYKKKGYKIFIGISNKKSKVNSLYDKLGFIKSKKNILREKRLK